MNQYDDFVAGKSLDGLLEEARKLDMKGEMTLEKVEKKEGIRNYEDGLVEIIGQELAPQKHENFFDSVRKISNIADLFHEGGDISSVLNNLVELYGLLEPIEHPKKLNHFILEITNSFKGAGKTYLKYLAYPSEEDLKIGNKVRTIFVPFFDTRLRGDDSVCSPFEGGRGKYFNERNVNFLPGSIGKIIGFYTNYLVVQFDKEGNWSESWRPNSSYWGEKKNAAIYEPKELKILPFSAVEICTLEALLENINSKLLSDIPL